MHPRTLPALSLAVALALSACASAPHSDPVPPVPPRTSPPAWSQPSGDGGATALAHWWNRFNDPVLGDLVTRALQANPSVQSAQAALRQARAQRDVQQAGNGPVGSVVSGSAQRSQNRQRGRQQPLPGRF